MSWSCLLDISYLFQLCCDYNKLIHYRNSLHPGSVDVMQAGAPHWRLHLHKHTHRDFRPSSSTLSRGTKFAAETLICDEESGLKKMRRWICELKQGAHFLLGLRTLPLGRQIKRVHATVLHETECIGSGRDSGDIKTVCRSFLRKRKLRIWLVCAGGNHFFHLSFRKNFSMFILPS